MYDCIQSDDDYENGDYNFDNNFMYHPPPPVRACVWIRAILIVFSQSNNHWLLYFICQNQSKEQQRRHFSFNTILCSFISPFAYFTLQSSHILNANARIPCCNWMWLMVMAASCMFISTSVIANHVRMLKQF